MDVTSIDKLLSTLDRVKLVKAGQWAACCPAHNDRTPSLKISETQDGIVLVKCWAGCTTAQVVAAVGLELRDLFPRSVGKPRRSCPSRDAINHERTVVAIGNSLLANGESLSSEDQARFDLARARLERLETKP